MAGSDAELRRAELAEVEGRVQVPLTPNERRVVRRWIKESLAQIISAGDGQRWDVLSRHALAVYRNGALLTGSASAFDARIIDAYKASGGGDVEWLHRVLAPTKVFAARHPKPRPAVSSRYATKTAAIGEWADAATAATGSRNHLRRAVILAVADEVTSVGTMTTAVELLADRHELGDSSNVRAEVRRLVVDGWLTQTGEAITLSGHTVTHYSLRANDAD